MSTASTASEEHMLNYLLERYPKLTEWEQAFVDDVSKLPEEQKLTPPQLAKLREIYDEH